MAEVNEQYLRDQVDDMLLSLAAAERRAADFEAKWRRADDLAVKWHTERDAAYAAGVEHGIELVRGKSPVGGYPEEVVMEACDAALAAWKREQEKSDMEQPNEQ